MSCWMEDSLFNTRFVFTVNKKRKSRPSISDKNDSDENPLDGNQADYKEMKEVSPGAHYPLLESKCKPDDEGIKPANK